MTTKTYEEMTIPERRIAICQDVIAQVQSRRYMIIADMGYVVPRDYHSRDVRVLCGVDSDDSQAVVTKEHVETLANTCSLCARGAMLLSRIDMFNSVVWGDLAYHGYIGGFQTTEGLAGVFESGALCRIENQFELTANDLLFIDIEDAADRLIAIMKYIIEHDGSTDFDDEEWSCAELERARMGIKRDQPC